MNQGLFDSVAVGASMLCLLHCLAVPLLIVLLPTVALFAAIPESFHLGMLLIALPTSIAAMALGYRHHQESGPAIFVIAGLTLLGFGALADISEALETTVTVLGGVTLALGHILNWRANHRGA